MVVCRFPDQQVIGASPSVPTRGRESGLGTTLPKQISRLKTSCFQEDHTIDVHKGQFLSPLYNITSINMVICPHPRTKLVYRHWKEHTTSNKESFCAWLTLSKGHL